MQRSCFSPLLKDGLIRFLIKEKVHLTEALFLCKHLQCLSSIHFCKGPNSRRGLNIEIAYISVGYLMIILCLISNKMYFKTYFPMMILTCLSECSFSSEHLFFLPLHFNLDQLCVFEASYPHLPHVLCIAALSWMIGTGLYIKLSCKISSRQAFNATNRLSVHTTRLEMF